MTTFGRLHRLALLTFMVGVAFGTSSRLTLAAGSRLCFYADSPHAPLPTGHAFVQLLPGNGPDAGRKDLVYGHHPKSPDPFTSGGETRSNADHSWDWKICFDVSDEQYNAVAAYIRGEIRAPSDFHLFGHNCTWWVTEIARIAQLEIPRTQDPSNRNIFDPSVFEDNLKKIGDGHRSAGGTVHHNSKGVTPQDSADPPPELPDVCSSSGLTTAAFKAAPELAKHLSMKLTDETLAPEILRAGQTLALSLSNVRLDEALVAVDFGDGTVIRQNLATRHVYQNRGEFRLVVIVVNTGAVNRFTFPVKVADVKGEGTKSITVPPAPNPPPRFNLSTPVKSPARVG